MSVVITKRDGTSANFDSPILVHSLLRAGASQKAATEIAKKVEATIKEGDATGEIYSKAFKYLAGIEKRPAIKYSLRRALFSLGPTGFPFEKFIAEIFTRKGYRCRTNLYLRGRCIEHEIDVLAQKDENIIMEIKFHNVEMSRSDLKTVLYVKSRFDDLVDSENAIVGNYPNHKIDRGILVTNTKFTTNAIQYAKCAGMELLGWGYPYDNSLRMMIEETSTHPITCLPSINKTTQKKFFAKGIITCRSLVDMKNFDDLDINRQTIKQLLEEASLLCTP